MKKTSDSLGIPNFGPWYLELLPEQNGMEELKKTYIFLKNMIKSNIINGLSENDINLRFINYGKTQLVFVLIVNDNYYTLIINQPATKYGVSKNEFNNLINLNQINSNLVIKPLYYFEKDNMELYITPYYYQSRCIGIETTDWGIWIPEPGYHFENFNNDERKIINSTMIASLIELYDENNNQGISKCRLDGGDFMLLKGFENEKITFENIYNNIKLIAARGFVNISLNEYIDRLKIELMNNTLKDEELIIVGKKLKNTFTSDEIELGIENGLKLRNIKNIKKEKIKEMIR